MGDQNTSVVWIDSRDSYEQAYGYFEVRCILGTGTGSNCAFWMAAGDPWYGGSRVPAMVQKSTCLKAFPSSVHNFAEGPVNRPTIDSTIHWQHNVYDDDGNKVGNKDHCYFFADTKITRDGDYLPTDMFDGNYHTIGVLSTKEEYIFTMTVMRCIVPTAKM